MNTLGDTYLLDDFQWRGYGSKRQIQDAAKFITDAWAARVQGNSHLDKDNFFDNKEIAEAWHGITEATCPSIS
ncbi:hypothetical protein PHISP_05668 [Aspergillus sp. HF37]|nr:hypothetical protein PHISP_05668 [Aspergillus sp. HF37]